MKDDYNYTETPYSREMEGQEERSSECPHGMLIDDEDCPDCLEEREQEAEPDDARVHDTWEEHRGER